MEEILIAAKLAGFETWGFTPHAPICLESPCNMKRDDVGKYLEEITRLRHHYPGIRILSGMEVDYIDDKHGPASPEVSGYKLDYVIGSVHFVPNQEGVYFDIDGSPERFQRILHEHFQDDLTYVVRTYWQQIEKMIDAGGLDIVGHIDKIALNASSVKPDIENDPEYISMSERAIGKAIRKGIAIEINTKHYRKYGRFFPHPKFWPEIFAAGTEMPVNSDAHHAELVESGMAEALQIYNEIKEKAGIIS